MRLSPQARVFDHSFKEGELRGKTAVDRILADTAGSNNLLDKEYYSSCSSGYYCQFANRRTVLAGLRYRW